MKSSGLRINLDTWDWAVSPQTPGLCWDRPRVQFSSSCLWFAHRFTGHFCCQGFLQSPTPSAGLCQGILKLRQEQPSPRSCTLPEAPSVLPPVLSRGVGSVPCTAPVPTGTTLGMAQSSVSECREHELEAVPGSDGQGPISS